MQLCVVLIGFKFQPFPFFSRLVEKQLGFHSDADFLHKRHKNVHFQRKIFFREDLKRRPMESTLYKINGLMWNLAIISVDSWDLRPLFDFDIRNQSTNVSRQCPHLLPGRSQQLFFSYSGSVSLLSRCLPVLSITHTLQETGL